MSNLLLDNHVESSDRRPITPSTHLPSIPDITDIECAQLHLLLTVSPHGIPLMTSHLHERQERGAVVSNIHECATQLAVMKPKDREVAVGRLRQIIRAQIPLSM